MHTTRDDIPGFYNFYILPVKMRGDESCRKIRGASKNNKNKNNIMWYSIKNNNNGL